MKIKNMWNLLLKKGKKEIDKQLGENKMKKTLKALLLVAFMLVTLLALTGCGDKLVATRETEEMGVKMEEEIEVSFKDDKVNKVKMTYTFDSKEQAEAMKSLLSLGMSMNEETANFDIKQSGKKIIMEADAKAYAEMAGDDVDISKDELREQFDDQGYTVK